MKANYLQIEKSLKDCETIELMFKHINDNFKTNQKLSVLNKNLIAAQLSKGIRLLNLEERKKPVEKK